MASSNKTTSSLALFLCLNLLLSFFLAARGSILRPLPVPQPPRGGGGGCPPPSSGGSPPPSSGGSPPPGGATCPRDSLQIGLCVDVLNLLNISLGRPLEPCCSLIEGLVDLEAAVCLCTSLKLSGLVNLKLPIYLNLLLGLCHREAPPEFQCA